MYDQTGRQPITRTIRFAISAGILTPGRLRDLEESSQKAGLGLLDLLNEAELLHLQLVQKALGPGATWQDAAAAIRRGRGTESPA